VRSCPRRQQTLVLGHEAWRCNPLSPFQCSGPLSMQCRPMVLCNGFVTMPNTPRFARCNVQNTARLEIGITVSVEEPPRSFLDNRRSSICRAGASSNKRPTYRDLQPQDQGSRNRSSQPEFCISMPSYPADVPRPDLVVLVFVNLELGCLISGPSSLPPLSPGICDGWPNRIPLNTTDRSSRNVRLVSS
jgi:hypothetical protein